MARAIGVPSVTVLDPFADPAAFERLLGDRLAAPELSVIVARRPCVLAAADIRRWEKAAAERAASSCAALAVRSRGSVMPASKVVNVVIAGLGGQGVIKASDILADAALRAGLDVKKAEIHGMSQRGGSVTSDVRFGEEVLSPDGAARRGRLPAGAGALRGGGGPPHAARGWPRLLSRPGAGDLASQPAAA